MPSRDRRIPPSPEPTELPLHEAADDSQPPPDQVDEKGEPWFTRYVSSGAEIPASEPERTAEEGPEARFAPEVEEASARGGEPDQSARPASIPSPPQPEAQADTGFVHVSSPVRQPRRVTLQPPTKKSKEPEVASREPGSVIAAARHSNLRRSVHVGKLMILTFVANALLLAGVVWWFMQHVELRIAESVPVPMPGSPQTAKAAAAPTAPQGPTADDLKALEASVTSNITELQTQLADALTRLSQMENQGKDQTAQLGEMAGSLTAMQTSLAEQKKAAHANKAEAPPAAPAPPPISIPDDLTPSEKELVLLKERNRLTAFADEAISSGARAPYERLWEALDDPRLAALMHAARTEILRVQNFYLSGSRLDRYDIPVGTYFPEDAQLKDTQLKDDQIISLLQNRKNPWEVRLKSAYLLGRRRSLTIGDALVKAVKEDNHLDVVKEATFSFEQMTGFRAGLFDADSLEKWWKEYRQTPTPLKLERVKAPPPATVVAPKEGEADEGEAAKGDSAKGETSKKGESKAPTAKSSKS